jgi:DNA-3-methyladenine glycosylase I|tara:strand:+ start:532 stop:1119 length:588 start_codon:yes stop_codon:yes gene_type:complete
MKPLKRCDWCLGNSLYEAYHDQEWGLPVFDDQTLFEFLILESFQAGLSWITILKKRENFRAAFDSFDYKKIAEYDREKYNSLIVNKGIVRNRLKIKAAISNAQAFLKIQEEFKSFSAYYWSYSGGMPLKNKASSLKSTRSKSKLSEALSKDLKRRGFKFVGSTIIYAFMQATGMVNDHKVSCFRYKQLTSVGNNF